MRRSLGVLASLLTAHLCASCEQSCLHADESCTVATPCEEVVFECASPNAPRAARLAPGDPIPGGLDALASPGDVVLQNGLVTAVIDAIDHPHYVAPTAWKTWVSESSSPAALARSRRLPPVGAT